MISAPTTQAAIQSAQAADNAPESSIVVKDLASYVYKAWDVSRLARRVHEITMLECLRQRNGQYAPDKLAAIKSAGGSEVYMMLTSLKCRSAASWIRDVMLDQGDPPWDIMPTPQPDLPTDSQDAVAEMATQQAGMMMDSGMPMDPSMLLDMKAQMEDQEAQQVFEQAAKIADRMKRKMKDQLAEGGWFESFDQFIEDLVTFQVGIIKGPIVRKRPKLQWVASDLGEMTPSIKDELVVEFERVSPFDLYVAPNARTIHGSYVIERHRMTRNDLNSLIGSPGYNDEAIKNVLDDYAISGFRNWLAGDQQRAFEEGRPAEWLDVDQPIDALEFTGSIPGKLLVQWGMTPKEVPDESREYNASVWVIGPYTIRAVLNYDPLGRKPYSITSYEKIPGSVYGKAIPQLIADVQQICNAAARSLVNNMGIASGPQVVVNIDRLAPGEDAELHPWKKWYISDDMGGKAGKVIEFYQPSPMVNELLEVFERFSRLADDYSGIPAYTYGNSFIGAAGRTASGLSMLMGAASKSIKQVISHIDVDIIAPIMERLYYHNMRYDEDKSIKGDVKVVARGTLALMVKEQLNIRRMEFLTATANPIDSQIVGMEGRAALLREIVKGLDMPVDKIVPDPRNVVPMSQTAANQAQGNVGTRETPKPQSLLPDGTPEGGGDVNQFQQKPKPKPK